MEIRTQYINVEKTARFSIYGKPGERTKYFWIALHGSKMRCEQLLYKFRDFDPEEHFVVAPEGLNRQYENGFGGDVVASWMTKRDRLEEIDDFSFYLDKLYSEHLKILPSKAQKIVLGFSQGGTTAFRWLHKSANTFEHLIAYSCWIPEDIDLSQSATKLKDIKLTYTYGVQDEYLTPERILEINSIIKRNNLDLDIIPYEGSHRVDRGHLMSLFESRIKK